MIAWTHLSGPVDSRRFKATANDMEAEANKPMEHAFTERGNTQQWIAGGSFTFSRCIFPGFAGQNAGARLSWRKCPRRCHTVAPGTATAAYAARWPSPPESWCRTSRRCRRRRDCPRRGLSPAPWRKRQSGVYCSSMCFPRSLLFLSPSL